MNMQEEEINNPVKENATYHDVWRDEDSGEVFDQRITITYEK